MQEKGVATIIVRVRGLPEYYPTYGFQRNQRKQFESRLFQELKSLTVQTTNWHRNRISSAVDESLVAVAQVFFAAH